MDGMIKTDLKKNSNNNRKNTALENFDFYICALTLNIKKELNVLFDEEIHSIQNETKRQYESKIHEQTDIFFESLLMNWEKNKNKRNELLNRSTWKITMSGKVKSLSEHPLFRQMTAIVIALPALCAGAMFACAKAAAAGAITAATISIITGGVLLAIGGIIGLSIATIIITKFIYTHFKKRETERLNKYLQDEHITELIFALLTSCIVEQLSPNKDLNESEIYRIAKKECTLLIKNLAKQEKNTNKECPHLIADEILHSISSTNDYGAKKREFILKHWLGALETTLKKSKHPFDLNVFLKKLNLLCQNTLIQKSRTHESPFVKPNNKRSIYIQTSTAKSLSFFTQKYEQSTDKSTKNYSFA